jgi:hypothetical protein
MSDKSDAAALERMTTMMLDAEAHKQRERTFVENEFAGIANQLEEEKNEPN